MIPTWGASGGAGTSFSAPLQSSLVPSSSGGSSTPTFTRATTAYVTDWEGLLKPVLSGEARFTGARRVQNFAPEVISAGNYPVNSATITTGIDDPAGGTSAYRLTATGADDGRSKLITHGAAAGGSVLNTIWLRRAVGTGAITINKGRADGSSTAVTITSSWQRFSAGIATTDGTAGYLGVSMHVSGDAVDVWHPQQEIVTGQSNQAPSEYVSVGVLSAPYHGAGVDGVAYKTTLNGNTVASNVVTEATGAAITPANGASTLTTDASGPFGYLAEGSRTNLQLRSQEFGNAVWAVSQATISTDSTVAPDGTTTADALLENVANNVHLVYAATEPITSAGTYTFSVYLKKLGRTWAELVFNDYGAGGVGTKYGFFNLDTGAVGTSSAGITARLVGALSSGWYRFSVTLAVASIDCNIQVRAAEADNDDFYAGDTSKGVYMWGAQVEAASFASSYIPTTTVAVTRNADVLTYPSAGNIAGTAGTAYVEFTTALVSTAAQPVLVSAPSGMPLYLASNKLTLFDGAVRALNSLSVPLSTVSKVATSWAGAASNGCKDGSAAPAAGFDGDLNVTQPIGVGCYSTASTYELYGTIRNLRLYPSALSSSQLQAMTGV